MLICPGSSKPLTRQTGHENSQRGGEIFPTSQFVEYFELQIFYFLKLFLDYRQARGKRFIV